MAREGGAGMIPRWRGATTAVPEGRSPAGPGGGVGFGARLQRFLRPAREPAGGAEAGKRRRLLTAALVVYLVVLVAGAVAYNLPLLRQQAVLRSQAERETRRVAGMQRLITDLDEERARS